MFILLWNSDARQYSSFSDHVFWRLKTTYLFLIVPQQMHDRSSELNICCCPLYQRGHFKSCLLCFQRNPLLCSSTEHNSGGQRHNLSGPNVIYSHWISCRWKTVLTTKKKINFGTVYFSELLFQSEMKWQNCPILVLFIRQIHYGCIYQPTPIRSTCARHYKTKSCSESWTMQKIILYCWNVLLGGVPSFITFLVQTFLE